MAYILMQPDNSQESLKGLRYLAATGECIFELSIDGPCPDAFGSRSNLPYEVYYYSFVGDITCGRWSVDHNRRYLWGKILLDLRLQHNQINIGIHW